MLEVVSRLVLTIFGDVTDEELADIQVRSIEQLSLVEELRSGLKSPSMG